MFSKNEGMMRIMKLAKYRLKAQVENDEAPEWRRVKAQVEKEEREETPFQREDESRRSSPPYEAMDKRLEKEGDE